MALLLEPFNISEEKEPLEYINEQARLCTLHIAELLGEYKSLAKEWTSKRPMPDEYYIPDHTIEAKLKQVEARYQQLLEISQEVGGDNLKKRNQDIKEGQVKIKACLKDLSDKNLVEKVPKQVMQNSSRTAPAQPSPTTTTTFYRKFPITE